MITISVTKKPGLTASFVRTFDDAQLAVAFAESWLPLYVRVTDENDVTMDACEFLVRQRTKESALRPFQNPDGSDETCPFCDAPEAPILADDGSLHACEVCQRSWYVDEDENILPADHCPTCDSDSITVFEDGRRLCGACGHEPKTSKIPIIMFTGVADKSELLISFNLGATDYIGKPTSFEEILARIKAALRYMKGEWREPTSKQMIVHPIFASRTFNQRTDTCLVLMPFRESWSDRLWNHLKKIVKKVGFECLRADDLYGNIIEDIWRALNEAEIVIADITGRNANVMYEVGIAHTIGKSVIILTQDTHDIPNDILTYRHIMYVDNTDGFAKLRTGLPPLMRHRTKSLVDL